MRLMQMLAEDVRGGVIEHCSHWITEACPDYLNEQLQRFLGKKSCATPH
jgi:hypothetical protein